MSAARESSAIWDLAIAKHGREDAFVRALHWDFVEGRESGERNLVEVPNGSEHPGILLERAWPACKQGAFLVGSRKEPPGRIEKSHVPRHLEAGDQPRNILKAAQVAAIENPCRTTTLI